MDRVNKIINMLLDHKNPIKINIIADQLRVSYRTIRYDLLNVEKYLNIRGLNLIKKTGIGISIDGTEKCKINVANGIKNNINSIELFSPDERRINILNKLLSCEKNIYIKDLAKELFVSNSTIHKDFDEIRKWLNKFDLNLTKINNYGIGVIGKEENFRNAMIALIVANTEFKEVPDKYKNSKFDYAIISKLKEIIDIDYDELEKIVTKAESTMKYTFTDESFTSLIVHLAISIKRIREGKQIIVSTYNLVIINDREEFKIAKQIAEDIYKYIDIRLPEPEIEYIYLHIIGSKMNLSYVNGIKFDDEKEATELAVIMAKEIIEIAQKLLFINLSNDKQALNALVLHLIPTINRLEYNLPLKNPILNEIKKNYPEIYGVAWMANTVFQKHLGKKITEEEVGYIALHIGAAIERHKKPISCIIICPSGIGISQFLSIKIEKHFKEIKIEEIVSIASIKGKNLNDIDLVISTVTIDMEKPVLVISPLLLESDISRIQYYINNLDKYSNTSIVNEDLIEVNATYKNKDEIIHSMSKRLLKSGIVMQSFEDSVIKRESSHSTEIGKGVAIPHGFPDSVNSSQIAVTLLKKPVIWGDKEYVDIIFMIAISNIDIKNSIDRLKNIYKEIDSDKFLQSLRNVKIASEVKTLLEKVIY